MNEEWYTNKQLFEMLQGLKDDMAETRVELAATRESVRRYNGLREDLEDVRTRVTAIEQQGVGRARVGSAIREWGSWIMALSSLVVAGVALWKKVS